MKKFVELDSVLSLVAEWCPDDDGSVGKTGDLRELLDELEALPACDVVTRDEGIKLGAELAAMHCSDATSQQLEKAFFDGFEEAIKYRNVKPVLHGHWIDTDNYYQRWRCSVCGCHTRDAEPNFCSSCGAEMDE